LNSNENRYRRGEAKEFFFFIYQQEAASKELN
jgi:hypothetical protein